jgi:phage gp29-like protein
MLQDLYDNLESDGHFISQVNLRKAATLCNSFSIIDKKSGDISQEKTELFNTEWFNDFVNYVLDSVMKGYTLLELIDPARMEFNIIPRRNVVPTKSLVLFEANGDKGIDYRTGYERTLIHIGKESDLGLMANLCGQLIWKRNAQQSWAEFAEKYGMPLISATTNKTAQPDIDKINQMLITLGEAARAVLPEGTTIDIKPFAGSDSFQVYDKQIERINSEIGKPITGGTMITDNGSSRSQSEVHERNLDDKISVQDRRMVEFVVNGQLIPIMQMWGYPLNPETDKFKYDDSFELSLKEHWEVVNSALNRFEIPVEWVSKTFNIPITGVKEIQQQQIFAQLDSRPDNSDKGTKIGGFAANFA